MKGETPTVDDYDIGQLLGRGGFASVYRARERRTGLLYAMKIMDKAHIKKHNMEIRVQNEIKIQSELKFQGIVQLRCHFEDSEYVYMILELCEGGNLYRYLKTNGPLDETAACAVIKQLLLALEYMHGLNVVHRDLKLSNVLLVKNTGDATASNVSLSQCHVKLCDFGLAVQVEHPDEEHFTLCGTPNYIAPEIASQRAHGFPADLWSVGCLFYSMLTGAPPFEQAGVKETLQCIITGQYTVPPGLSEQAEDFMKCLINLNPLKRHNVAEILDHEFLRLNEIKLDVTKNAPISINRQLFRNDSVSSTVSPNSKNGIEENSVNLTDRKTSSDTSTVDLNESKAHQGSRAVATKSKWASTSSRHFDSGDHNTSCSASSSSTSDSSSVLSCSSPSKSIVTGGSTVVSKYCASSASNQRERGGRSRTGTSPGVEKEFSGRIQSAAGLATRIDDCTGKYTGRYVYGRDGHRRREDEKEREIANGRSKRETLRGPTLSAEPEMASLPPPILHPQLSTSPLSSSGCSPSSAASPSTFRSSFSPESSSRTTGFCQQQQHHFGRCNGDTSIAPTSWLQAIRSIRQSVDDSNGVPSSEASVANSHGSPLGYAMRMDVGGSMGSLRGVLNVAGQIGGSYGQPTTNGFNDGINRRSYQHQERQALPQQQQKWRWSERGNDSYRGEVKRAPLPTPPSSLPNGMRNSASVSKSISIENSTMNGSNWFGESSSSASTRPLLKQFCFVCPNTAVLVLNDNGMAMYCGIIKDKSGRSLPCRLYSSSRTPNVVTLGKLDEGMLKELQTIWTAQNHGNFSDSDSDSESENDTDSVDEAFIEKHESNLCASTSSVMLETISVTESALKKEASQYSEFDSFYNYDSDDDKKKEEAKAEITKKVLIQSQAAAKRKERVSKTQKKETSSAALLHAVRGLRLFSDELLLRSYSVNATAATSFPISTLNCSVDCSVRTSTERRLSALPPLPAALFALYGRAAEVFTSVRRRVPRIIMYIPAAEVKPSTDPVAGIALKCSLMSNGPLPDLLCRWANGTKLRYSLQTGSTAIDCPPKVLSLGLYSPIADVSQGITHVNSSCGMTRKSKTDSPSGYSWEGDLISAISSSSSFSTMSPSSTAYSRSLELELDPNPIPDALKIYLELAQKALKRILKEDADMSSSSSTFHSRSRIRAHGNLSHNENGENVFNYDRKVAQSSPSFPRVFVGHL